MLKRLDDSRVGERRGDLPFGRLRDPLEAGLERGGLFQVEDFEPDDLARLPIAAM